VTFRDDIVDALPPGAVAYLPRVRPLREAPAGTFARGEALEFRQQDLNGAVTVFREQTRAGDPAIRTGAWLRLARTFQKAERTDEALDAYAQVTNVDDVAVDGVSAALVARYARCRLFEKHNRPDDLRAEAQELDLALHAGRWALIAPVYWLYSADAA